MFGQQVSTPFVGDIADEMFPKVESQGIGFDESFVGTARAILAPRMGSYDGKVVMKGYYDAPRDDDMIEGIMRNPEFEGKKDVLLIMSFSSFSDDFTIETAIEKAVALNPQYQQDMKVRSFFGQFNPKFDVACLLDMENHRTLLITSDTNIRQYHAMQSAMPRFFPWFFTENKATPKERELLLSLCNRSPRTHTIRGTDGAPDTTKAGYVDLMMELSELYDFRSAKVAKLIPTFMKNVGEVEMESVKREMARIDRDINNYEESILTYLRQRHDLEIRLAGLNSLAGRDDDSGLTEWFQSAKGVEIYSASNGNLVFEVYTILSEWDDDLADVYLDNKNSDMYVKTCGMTKDRWEILMKGIWKNRDIRIRTCGAYKMVVGEGVNGMSNFMFSKDTATRVPNAHIQHHGCTGGFKRMMCEAVQRGDYVMAMETAVLSARSMAFNDISFCEFIKDMSDSKDKKFLEDKEGNLYTPSEAVKFLKNLYKEDAKK